MKIKILIVIILTICISCKKEDITIYGPGPEPYGLVNAQKNNNDWNASGSAHRHENDNNYFGLFFNTYTSKGFLREKISLNKIPMEIGQYKISGPYNNLFDGFIGGRYHTSQDDGDVSEDNYSVDESASDNFLEITYLDTIANIIKGNFSVSFNIATIGGKVNPDNPAKIKFSNGSFEVEFFN